MSEDETVFEKEFSIEGGNFSKGGIVSGEIKRIAKEIGISPAVIRRLSIAVYETEMNVVSHAYEAKLNLQIHSDHIHILCADKGPGIEDIDLAMQEGYSTASETVREMGFGAGMGLPNIKRNVDDLSIESKPGEGTTLKLEVKFA